MNIVASVVPLFVFSLRSPWSCLELTLTPPPLAGEQSTQRRLLLRHVTTTLVAQGFSAFLSGAPRKCFGHNNLNREHLSLWMDHELCVLCHSNLSHSVAK